MLQSIRDRTQGWIAKIILGAVCVTFALWGIHNYFNGSAGNSVAAKVNGVAISNQQLLNTLRQIQTQQSNAFGANANQAAALQAQQQQQALNQLITQQLLTQQLTKLRLVTPDSTLQQILEQMPPFQENGRFSITRYQQLLQSQGLSSATFLAGLKQQLEITQLQNGIVYSDFALPTDVDKFIALMNETRRVGYIIIPQNHFKPAPVSDAVVKAYYDSHQSEFMQPPEVQLSYVQLSLGSVTQALIQQGVPADKAKQQASTQLADLSDKLANLVYEQPTSLDPVVKQLGLPLQTTSFFTEHSVGDGITTDPKVRSAAFASDVFVQGYNSSVINLDDGSQVVVRVLAKKPATVAPLADVKASIISKMQAQTNQDAAVQLAGTLAKALSQGQAGSDVASGYQLAWQVRDGVTRHEQGVDSNVLQQVFHIPAPKDAAKPSVDVIHLANGNTAVVAIFQVIPGDPKTVSASDKEALANQIARGLGQVDFALYINSLKDKANVRIYPSVTQ